MKAIIFLLCAMLPLIHCTHKSGEQSREPATVTSSQKRLPNLAQKLPNYEICQERNQQKSKMYIEEKIQELPFDLLKDHTDDWDKSIPIQCIQFAQKNFRGTFAYCKNEDAKPEMGAPRPCLTENYTQLVYNAFHDVKNCFNLDPKNSFLQIMIESGFHINAINKTGFDSGVAQFTKNGIYRVTERNLIDRTRKILLESSNPACQRIASTMGKLDLDSFSLEKRCSMMALPQNPYRGFLMHYLHTLRDQIFFKEQLIQLRPQLQEIINDEIIEQLVYFAYNRGKTGTLRLLDGYLDNRQKAGQVVTSDDLNLWANLSQIRSDLKLLPAARAAIKKAKIKKMTFAQYAVLYDQNYLANISEARDFVRSRFGDQCSF